MRDLSWNHCTSTPHRSETNGIVERAVRRVKEGTSAVLLQSGLSEKWWADSMECYCYPRNIQDLLSGWKQQMKGGSECHLPDQKHRLEQWSNITLFLRKIFRDYISLVRKSCQENSSGVSCARVKIWKGDVTVADIEELEEMDASELHARRRNAKDASILSCTMSVTYENEHDPDDHTTSRLQQPQQSLALCHRVILTL